MGNFVTNLECSEHIQITKKLYKSFSNKKTCERRTLDLPVRLAHRKQCCRDNLNSLNMCIIQLIPNPKAGEWSSPSGIIIEFWLLSYHAFVNTGDPRKDNSSIVGLSTNAKFLRTAQPRRAKFSVPNETLYEIFKSKI
jgi:hypothetical protein